MAWYDDKKSASKEEVEVGAEVDLQVGARQTRTCFSLRAIYNTQHEELIALHNYTFVAMLHY